MKSLKTLYYVAVFIICIFVLGRGYILDADNRAVIDDQNIDHKEFVNKQRSKLTFRNDHLLKDHYNRHGKAMGFSSAKEYEDAARNVVNNPYALHKYEKEDGDDVYFVESTNDFVVVSTDGYIRTYFQPNNGRRYFDKQ